MPDQKHIEELLEQILESGATPEGVCVGRPDLLDEVSCRWEQLRCVEAQVDALFPTPHGGGEGDHPERPVGGPMRIPGYEVQAVLGRGGMGVVFKARHLRLNRTVAIKMMLAGGYADPPQSARFMREAQTVAGLRHPNVVQVYDMGDLDGVPYFTMEYVGGGTLSQKLAGAPQPALAAAALTATLAGAVHLAHQGGVVHRDLKPANILLAGDGTPKISDFGLARRVDGAHAISLSGAGVGTPSYMPPEQATGAAGAAGPLVDIYSLGAILYEMLTGRPPFKAETAAETVRQLISAELVSPSRLNPKVPCDLETICLKCLHKDPQRRYPTALALADDLERFRQGVPITARRSGLWERTVKLARRRPTAAALAGVAAMAVVAVAIGAVGHNRQLEETRQRTRAATLVRALAVAETRDVPRILDDLGPYQRHADPLLAQMLADMPADSKARLHASLALLPGDETQLEYLVERLLGATPHELSVIRTALTPHRDRVTDRLWASAHSRQANGGRQLRAACGLAALDPDGPPWAVVAPAVAASLTAESTLLVGAWTDLLRPARLRLLAPLSEIARRRATPTSGEVDPEHYLAEVQQGAVAVSILADYAGDKPDVLVDLLTDLGRKSFDVLFPRLAVHGDEAAIHLISVIGRTLPPDASDADHDRRAQRRANAAVALLRLGRADRVWPLLQHSTDPSHRSYLIHRFSSLGVDPHVLVYRFDQEPDVSARRALLLALGEYPEFRAPRASDPADGKPPAATERPELPSAVAPRLLELYRTDPDPGLHAAAAWTLRQWGFGKELAEIDRQLSSRREQPAKRPGGTAWWVNTQGQTMVRIAGPVEFTMGSPEGEPDRDGDEEIHARHIGRSFAVAAHHVTVAQFNRFNSRFTHGQLRRRAPDPDCPIIGVTWYEAAQYCNWLSRQEGIPEAQWCYLPNQHGQYAEGMRLAPDYLQRTGYRLPTEAEWEYSCRAGAECAHYFGRSEDLLPKYAWYLRNSDERTWPVGSLKPNDIGLFDVHGGAWNWCSDNYTSYKLQAGPRHLTGTRALIDVAAAIGGTGNWSGLVAEQARRRNRPDVFEQVELICEDATREPLVTEAAPRVLRGGSFLYPAGDLRCANRNWVRPSYRNYNVGFRVARTLVFPTG